MFRIILLLTIIFKLSLSYTQNSDIQQIKNHFIRITKTEGYRNYSNISLLNKTAEYIKDHFSNHSDSTSFQEFNYENVTYKNVICSFGTENSKRIIIGAHYDVCGNQEGADDNASGLIGLLELARMLEGKKLTYRIDLVAYTLEEPPFFRSEFMGSYIHAKSLFDNKIDIYGMISLEMIAYFKEEKGSQTYPISALSLIYGKRGNFITLVKKMKGGKFVRKFCKKFKKEKKIKTKKFSAPASLPGIDFSDHLNYWKFGYKALMITDTAFFRNKNYHEKSDKMEELDFEKMALVINSVFETILKF